MRHRRTQLQHWTLKDRQPVLLHVKHVSPEPLLLVAERFRNYVASGMWALFLATSIAYEAGYFERMTISP
jgi:hypothetical protein